jgi:hypothetical protein
VKHGPNVVMISCSHCSWNGGARRLGPWSSGGGWWSETHAANPQEPTGYPVLHHALGRPTTWQLGNTLAAARHKGEGLPSAMVDGHGEFITRAEILDRPTALPSTGFYSTKPEYRRQLLSFSPKFVEPDVDN